MRAKNWKDVVSSFQRAVAFVRPVRIIIIRITRYASLNTAYVLQMFPFAKDYLKLRYPIPDILFLQIFYI